MLINQIRKAPNTLTVEMNQTQSYLRWKEDKEFNEFSTQRIAKEEDLMKTPDRLFEELNMKEPFKYRK